MQSLIATKSLVHQPVRRPSTPGTAPKWGWRGSTAADSFCTRVTSVIVLRESYPIRLHILFAGTLRHKGCCPQMICMHKPYALLDTNQKCDIRHNLDHFAPKPLDVFPSDRFHHDRIPHRKSSSSTATFACGTLNPFHFIFHCLSHVWFQQGEARSQLPTKKQFTWCLSSERVGSHSVRKKKVVYLVLHASAALGLLINK